ncbi:hypothetical protein HYT55_02485 [Candidatus Woesearchaeota archaeon]|nr:hypothetical protein [Candidatus Woesearchaeota archaeon]
MGHKSKLSRVLEYWTRQAGRGIFLVLAIAILFLVIMGFIYIAPRIWKWATG